MKALVPLLLALPMCAHAQHMHASSPHAVHDNNVNTMVTFDRLEGFDSDNGGGLAWSGRAWVGTDTDKLWLRSEGERRAGRTTHAEVEALYGRPIARWWDGLIGVRHDAQPSSQDWLALGVTGTAPGKIDVEATAYLGSGGRAAARVEAEYDVLLTNRLILQPLVEANVYPGRSTVEAGLRLRFEVRRQFAPYVGIVRVAHSEEDAADETRIVAGLRLWL